MPKNLKLAYLYCKDWDIPIHDSQTALYQYPAYTKKAANAKYIR